MLQLRPVCAKMADSRTWFTAFFCVFFCVVLCFLRTTNILCFGPKINQKEPEKSIKTERLKRLSERRKIKTDVIVQKTFSLRGEKRWHYAPIPRPNSALPLTPNLLRFPLDFGHWISAHILGRRSVSARKVTQRVISFRWQKGGLQNIVPRREARASWLKIFLHLLARAIPQCYEKCHDIISQISQ